ncbi:hypothetical protein Taro_043565 [Colocasia esculenta]|uniref:Uncharacterized protein n=1 Tax=Colocasia esculenta TaxID=4460 RepID=A0A843WGS0_COLES|nr:hypothetical protein [Colocasia esculenta]
MDDVVFVPTGTSSCRGQLGMALLLFFVRIRALPIVAALLLIIPFSAVWCHTDASLEGYPVVVSTWPFLEAVRAAWGAVERGSSAVEAVVDGCSVCEELRCDGTGRHDKELPFLSSS